MKGQDSHKIRSYESLRLIRKHSKGLLGGGVDKSEEAGAEDMVLPSVKDSVKGSLCP